MEELVKVKAGFWWFPKSGFQFPLRLLERNFRIYQFHAHGIPGWFSRRGIAGPQIPQIPRVVGGSLTPFPQIDCERIIPKERQERAEFFRHRRETMMVSCCVG